MGPLTTDLERPATGCLPLLRTFLCFGSCATQHLQEIGSASAHAAVNVSLAGLDVIVEVIAECLDVRDDFFTACGCEVTWEEDCGYLC